MLTTPATTPMILTLGLNPVVVNLLVGGFLLVSIVMILIVLIQRPQGGGLGGAFGAGGGGGAGGAGQTAFGTKTGDVLTWATIGIFVLFLLLAIVLNFVTRPQSMVAAPTMTSPDAPASQQGGGMPADDPEESGSGETLSDEPIAPDTDQTNDQSDGADDAESGDAPSDDPDGSDGTTRTPGSTEDDG